MRPAAHVADRRADEQPAQPLDHGRHRLSFGGHCNPDGSVSTGTNALLRLDRGLGELDDSALPAAEQLSVVLLLSGYVRSSSGSSGSSTASRHSSARAADAGAKLGPMLDHVGIQCADLDRSAAFYDTVLAPLGASRLFDYGVAIGYGIPPHPDFWIGVFDSGEGFRESHLAFTAPSRAVVREFFEVAVAAGAEVLHEPRVWPEYHEHYYGAFVRDPDGNNVEAVCHAPEPEA